MSDLTLLVSAYIVDLIIGDPVRFPHPVRGIGWCIEKAEHILREKMVYSDYPAEGPPAGQPGSERRGK
jgi:cobalamin biosynthesis protein CobD/CbiB